MSKQLRAVFDPPKINLKEFTCPHCQVYAKQRWGPLTKVIDGTLSSVKGKFGKNRVRLEIEGDGGFVASLPGVDSMTEDNNSLELKMSEGASQHQLLKSVIDKVTVKRFEVVEPSLYDIFIETARIPANELESVREGSGHG